MHLALARVTANAPLEIKLFTKFMRFTIIWETNAMTFVVRALPLAYASSTIGRARSRTHACGMCGHPQRICKLNRAMAYRACLELHRGDAPPPVVATRPHNSSIAHVARPPRGRCCCCCTPVDDGGRRTSHPRPRLPLPGFSKECVRRTSKGSGSRTPHRPRPLCSGHMTRLLIRLH